MPELSRSARKVAEALAERGLEVEVQELPESTRSARDAAAALGCDVAQITKSLIFRDVGNDRPVLVLASGPDGVTKPRSPPCSAPGSNRHRQPGSSSARGSPSRVCHRSGTPSG